MFGFVTLSANCPRTQKKPCQDMRRRLEAEVLALRAKLSEPSTPSQLRYTELARKVNEKNGGAGGRNREKTLRPTTDEHLQGNELFVCRSRIGSDIGGGQGFAWGRDVLVFSPHLVGGKSLSAMHSRRWAPRREIAFHDFSEHTSPRYASCQGTYSTADRAGCGSFINSGNHARSVNVR